MYQEVTQKALMSNKDLIEEYEVNTQDQDDISRVKTIVNADGIPKLKG
jgi:hypothetical protein